MATQDEARARHCLSAFTFPVLFERPGEIAT
jgi:hypothetical protein